MRLEDLNWFDVEEYLKSDDRLIFVLGACEQHGYLSLLSDVQIPQALADAASQKTGVLVAPSVSYGISPYFQRYPGTFSLRLSTMVDLVEDLVHSAYGHGFRRLLFLNGHGGNDPARTRLYELANSLPELHLAWYAWWQAHSVETVAIQHGLKSFHAGWIEAFDFNLVADLPVGEKIPPKIPGLVNAATARQLYGDGVFGGPYQVDRAILQEVFDTALEDILHLLEFDA
jgi:creatinine amidohydrolase